MSAISCRFLVLFLIMGLVAVAPAEPLVCSICGNRIQKKYFFRTDEVTGAKAIICMDCAELTERCNSCLLPIKNNVHSLPDGRYLCDRDFKNSVQSDAEAKQICADVVSDLDHLFARWMTFPQTNVLLSIVDRFYLENLMKAPEEGQVCASVNGVTCSRLLPPHRFIHTVAILSYFLKPRLMAVCAHEYTHAWMRENVSRERHDKIDKDTVEAMCELVAYKYMASRSETNEMAVIVTNNYTKGKISVLIAAEEKFGFGPVLEWIKGGDDATLTLDNLERVRAVQGTYVPSQNATAAFYALPVAAVKATAPDTLSLKGISGTGSHRFALINSTTFEVMEKARVRLGPTNVSVQCVEIGNNFVTVQINGGEKKQLTMRTTD